MSVERPGYKQDPLWIEAMAVAREAYALAEELRGRDREGALHLRKAAVAAAAHVAGALSAEEAPARATDVSAARAALSEVALRAEAMADASAPSRELLRHARELERAIGLQFGVRPSFVC